jgi:hypothetical protein
VHWILPTIPVQPKDDNIPENGSFRSLTRNTVPPGTETGHRCLHSLFSVILLAKARRTLQTVLLSYKTKFLSCVIAFFFSSYREWTGISWWKPETTTACGTRGSPAQWQATNMDPNAPNSDSVNISYKVIKELAHFQQQYDKLTEEIQQVKVQLKNSSPLEPGAPKAQQREEWRSWLELQIKTKQRARQELLTALQKKGFLIDELPE